jgi:ABC-type nitrate/sulfonate/bicarbonate transport system permease component
VALLLIVVVMDSTLSLAERRLLRWRPRASAVSVT